MAEDSTPTSEAGIIAHIAKRFHTSDKRVTVGIGDDAAVLQTGDADSAMRPNATSQVVTTDLLIEGVHFNLDYTTLADIGYKALAVNLSDIAAMGATPQHAFGVLGVPRGTSTSAVDSLLDGVAEVAAEHGVSLVGGDTVAAPQWVIGFTVLGEVRGQALTRSKAQPGDMVWHSGQLGLSTVGLSLLADSGSQQQNFLAAYNAHQRPQAQIALGRFLQQHQLASSCTDTSDSLAQCLLSLCDASDVDISLDFTGYPFADDVRGFTNKMRRWRKGGDAAFRIAARYSITKKQEVFHSLAQYVLASAEDYALLFTAPPAAATMLLRNSPVRLTCLGSVVAAGEGRYYRAEDSKTCELRRIGFEHM